MKYKNFYSPPFRNVHRVLAPRRDLIRLYSSVCPNENVYFNIAKALLLLPPSIHPSMEICIKLNLGRLLFISIKSFRDPILSHIYGKQQFKLLNHQHLQSRRNKRRGIRFLMLNRIDLRSGVAEWVGVRTERVVFTGHAIRTKTLEDDLRASKGLLMASKVELGRCQIVNNAAKPSNIRPIFQAAIYLRNCVFNKLGKKR